MIGKRYLAALAVFLVIGLLFFTNHQKKISKNKRYAQQENGIFSKNEAPLTPAEPAQYKISQENQQAPKTQKQWESDINKSLVQTKVVSKMREQGQLNAYKDNPEELKQRIQNLNEQIKQNEKSLVMRPNDQSVKNELQTLYMLSSTLSAFYNEVAGNKRK